MWPAPIDAFLIFWYRIPQNPWMGFCLGTSVLALLCVLAGEFTLSLGYLVNRRKISGHSKNMVAMHNLSVRALELGDESSYKACNKVANEAFGRAFFTQIALAAAMLWPLPWALHWMGKRFSLVEFPLPLTIPVIGGHVSYPFMFLLFYVLARIGFKSVRHKLPYFGRFHRYLLEEKAKVPAYRPFPGFRGGDG